MNRTLAWLVAALPMTACGYTFGSGLHQQGIRTVHLQVVGNATWRQRIEAELGAELARELPVSTDLLPADARTAEATLEVHFADARERTLVVGDRQNPKREGSLEGLVHIRLVRRSDGVAVVDRDIVDRTEFRDPIAEDLVSARAELISDLARKIALALEASF